MGLVLQFWTDYVSQLKHVCRMLSRRRSLARLVETCFSHGPFVHMQKELKEFGKADVYEGRWGSISAATGKVLLVKRVLKAGWSMEKFTHGQVAKQKKDDDDEQHYTNISLANEAILSTWFWAYATMLDVLGEGLDNVMHWAEGCPCHWVERRLQGPSRHSARRKKTKHKDPCPLSGMRAPELAAGMLDFVLARI